MTVFVKDPGRAGARFLVLAFVISGVLPACSGARSGSRTDPLKARLDLMEVENAEQVELIQEMSARITELENALLKQHGDLKKIKVAIGTAPKTISPSVQEADTEPTAAPGTISWSEGPTYQWDDSPIIASGQASVEWADASEESDEPKIVLKLYGSSPEPQKTASSSGASIEPASLMKDIQNAGAFVPLKLPSLDTVAKLGDALGGTDASGQSTPAGVLPDPPKTPVDPYAQALVKYQGKEWSSAILYMDLYLKHNPTGSNVVNALFLKAESLYQMKSWLEAIGQFELVVKRWPDGPRVAEAQLRIGRCFEKLGDKKKAASVYGEVVAAFPGSAEAKKAQKLLQAIE